MDILQTYHELERLLGGNSRYCMADGTLIKSNIVDDALGLNPSLIKLLVRDELMVSLFFAKVDDILVFDKIKFQRFVSNKKFLEDSYTSFRNKIGLSTVEGQFVSEDKSIVLSWPYKDCMLEGGQTKEEAKRDEIFWNYTLAPEQINRITEPKAFSNFKRYDKEGERLIDKIGINDNLIIKGNNLLSLYSIREKYAGKVKLIYIDPPYYFQSNKAGDTFNYNTNFKLSTWCTFMKNRLEVARDLLSDDGAIFVQISDDGVAELHLLMKEIFNRNGENNFINKITVRTKSPSGFGSVNPGVFETAEYILAFAKHKQKWTYNPQFVETQYDENYKWIVVNKDAPCSQWEIKDLATFVAEKEGYKDKDEAIENLGDLLFKKKVSDYALEYKDAVYQPTAIGNDAGADCIKARELSKINSNKVYKVERQGHYTVYAFNGREMAFYSKKVRKLDGKLVPTMQLTNMWTDISYEGIAKEGKVKLKGGKKPEKLLRRIIEMGTNKGDIVLDFFSGTGTTAAVAYKLGRQFITCEQLESNLQLSLTRLKGVAKGDNSPVSKIVGWKGGGSFVYFELAKANETYREEIQQSAATEELKLVWMKMVKTGYLNYKVDINSVNENASDFESLSIDEQKKFLTECLDMNMLYIPYAEIDSEEYNISETDREMSKMFYSK